MDYHSRWIEVDVVRATTSKIIIQCLDSQFARYGISKSLRTDNSPNLVSNEIEDYLKEMGVEHRHTTPLWLRANGEVERQNRTLLKAIRAAHVEEELEGKIKQVPASIQVHAPFDIGEEPSRVAVYKSAKH